MPTLIQHIPTGHHFVLIGTGYGVWATARQSRGFDFIIRENQGEAHVLHVCDAQGRIQWLKPQDCRVVSVDGLTPAEALRGLAGGGAGDPSSPERE
jgi:hypothetical protein